MQEEDIGNLMEKLRKLKSKDEACKMLDVRGRACIGKSMLKKAEDARKNSSCESEIVENLKKKVKFLKVIDGKLYMIYPKCYCHHLKNFEGDVPKSYCYCSESWVKKLFETALARDVNVEIEKSVKWGDERCMIRVDL